MMGGFQGGLAFQAHRLVYHSTLGLIVIKKKKKMRGASGADAPGWSLNSWKSVIEYTGILGDARLWVGVP